MSRMATPTMDVLRFKEGDVIVASGYMTAQLSNLGNGSSCDAFLEFLNGDKVDYGYNQLAKMVDEGFDVSFNNGTDTRSLSTMVGNDKNDDGVTDASFNGIYKKDENGKWKKQ